MYNIQYTIYIQYIGGTLKDLIESKSQKIPFKIEEILNIMNQIISGIKYLHRENIVHRDIKPENIFLTSDFYIKLGDFGLSSTVNKNDYTRINICSNYYAAPEIILGREHKLEPDIWALGCVLYEMITLQKAYNGINRWYVQNMIVAGKYDVGVLMEVGCPVVIVDLIRLMFTQDRLSRPDIFLIASIYKLFIYIYIYNIIYTYNRKNYIY